MQVCKVNAMEEMNLINLVVINGNLEEETHQNVRIFWCMRKYIKIILKLNSQ